MLFIAAEVSYLVVGTLKGARLGSGLSGATFVDTSALIDGRLLSIAEGGFVPRTLIIPTSVIGELHLLADKADPEKRQRARHGLDVVERLKTIDHITVRIHDDGPLSDGGVDQRLISLALKYDGFICTVDYNLNKVASVQGIKVLNVNELANGVKTAYLPGESLEVMLTQKGQEAAQAVGYLPDGTMVVVDKAASRLHQSVTIEVIRNLQTAAGRMVFARLVPGGNAIANEPDTVNGDKDAKRSGRQRSACNRSRAKQPENIQKHTTSTSRRRSGRKTGEDSLIELVNNQ